MARLRTEDEIVQFEKEIGDRFGPPPVEVQNLLFQLRVKILAAAAGLSAVTVENGQLLLQHPDPESRFGSAELSSQARRSRRGLWLGRLSDPDWQERLIHFLRELQLRARPRKEGLRPHPLPALRHRRVLIRVETCGEG